MEENTKKTTEGKLSYEDLKNVASQLSAQAEALYKENVRLKEAIAKNNAANLFAELEMNFKVLNYKDSFDPDFVKNCVKNIQDIMTPKNSEESEDK